jgi:predicted ATPase/class 3 adenylate cyclase
MAELPSGTVTFLFTDIEGSTTRWEHQPEAMRVALARHDALVRTAIREHDGHVVKTMGDAFHAVFVRAPDAVATALDVQRRLQAEPWGEIGSIRVRMAVHTGTAEERGGDYYGPPLNRAARLMSAAHGGQVLLSQATYELVRDTPPEGVTFVNLGEHRLKDLIRPERVFQLAGTGIPSAFPPLVSLDARPHNLPLQVTTLLGREQDVQAVRSLLLRDDVRLVTLTGPGGTGKTHLGLQVAADLLEHFEDGAFIVELAPISDPGLVLSTIAQALGVRDVGGRPMLDAIVGYLHGRRLLLLLDNFEQVLAAAPVVTGLLRTCTGLSVLATSRAPLQIGGEREFPVPPLALPDPVDLARPMTVERLSQYAAVALFVERAVAVKPDFTMTNQNAPAVAEICVRLDGLPLAVELAAARTRLLSPDAMLARLGHGLALLTGGRRDLPARQQTLRGAIAWSYDLLDPDEQRLFRRLGVFIGGFTLDTAEAVCNVEGALGIDVLDGLESLVSKSLVKQQAGAAGDSRSTMLETIREYALERLEESGEVGVLRRQHAEQMVALAEDGESQISGPDEEVWLNRLQAEHDNLRAALAWSLTEEGDIQRGIRLAGAIARFWQVRGHASEGGRWYDLLLTAGRNAPGSALAKVLLGAGWLAHNRGDILTSTALFEEGVRYARAGGDPGMLATAVGNLGISRESLGEYEQAEQLLGESLAVFREIGNEPGIAARLHNLGNVACARGDFERATALLEESLAIRRRIGGAYSTALAIAGLGLAALYQGDDDRATRHFEEAQTLFRQLSHTYGIAWSCYYLGRVALRRGDDDEAATLLGESLEERRRLGDRRGIAQSLEGLAALASARQQAAWAARFFAVADGLRQELEAPLSPAERTMYERDVARVRAQADEDTFATAWAEGRAMTLEQAIAYALEEPSPT